MHNNLIGIKFSLSIMKVTWTHLKSQSVSQRVIILLSHLWIARSIKLERKDRSPNKRRWFVPER